MKDPPAAAGGSFPGKEPTNFRPLYSLDIPIKQKIETVAKEEGMQFVFDKTEQAAILLYADSAYEITYKVLDKLKRGK